MTEMLLALARATRRGRRSDPDLARAAAVREMQLQAELSAVEPMGFAAAVRDADPGAPAKRNFFCSAE